MTSIHPSAIVDPGAELGADVQVGPLCVIERGAIVGDRCQLASHVVVHGRVTLGSDNQIYEGAVIGGRPQHLRANPAVGSVSVGRGNIIREHATIHCALEPHSHTLVGDFNLLMVNAHVAHDCRIGSNTILVNNVMIGGHVVVEDRAYLSGGVGVHQFCRVGCFAMVRGVGRVTQDVPPYVTFDGLSRNVAGLNVIGLRRNGFTSADLQQLKSAYRLIYRSGLPWADMLDMLAAQFPSGPAAEFSRFFASGTRGFVHSRQPARHMTLPLVGADSDEQAPRRQMASRGCEPPVSDEQAPRRQMASRGCEPPVSDEQALRRQMGKAA